ncbi:MAG: hypothetical protein NC311_11635 [Muribaculaceae bacterium]|nr:hypothetical protein [Muribaculaceae bacterium]
MITYIDLYNEMTGQAWSMFDGEVEAVDEFETSVTTSIQKALNTLWNSYKFPFREKTKNIRIKGGNNIYSTPSGNIIKKSINGKKRYLVKIDKTYLEYDDSIELLEDEAGTPEKFTIKNDKIYLYPIPDKNYTLEVEYWSIFSACDENGTSKATLEEEKDYIDISEKYENLFKMALLPLCMMYAISSETDEYYSGYKKQYEDAYKILIEYTKSIDKEKRIGW